MTALLEQIAATPFPDWVALTASVAYVYLAARDNNWCWLFAAVGSLVWAHQMWVEYALVSDALLNLFYFGMALVGIYRWRGERRQQRAQTLDHLALPPEGQGRPPIRRMTPAEHATVIVSGLFLGYALASFARMFRPDVAMIYWDGFTTAFSILAPFLLIARRIDNWLYFMIIDVAYVYIYLLTGAYLYLLVMIVYIGMAAYGYLQWHLAIDRGHEVAA
jgi:nicotinamide mononucleotide transporter